MRPIGQLAAGIAALTLAIGVATAGAREKKPPDPREATPEQIEAYYESGRYDRDTKAIMERARRSLRRQLDGQRSDGNDAIVLDIDDTSLSSYDCQKGYGGFGSSELALCVVGNGADTTTAGDGLPRIGPVRRFFKLAQRLHVRVHFITGRPDFARQTSTDNLRRQGFGGEWTLTMQPAAQFAANTASGASLIPYKSAAREAFEHAGERILVNVGDQKSDLKGGHAERSFLVPNPMYFTP